MLFWLLTVQKTDNELAIGVDSEEIISYIESVKTKMVYLYFLCLPLGLIAFIHSIYA